MNERKDDIIIGLLVVIIVLQVYGLFLGNNSAIATDDSGWQNYGGQETVALPADGGAVPADEGMVKALGDAVQKSNPADDPNSGANVPGVPGDKNSDKTDSGSKA